MLFMDTISSADVMYLW